MSGPLEGMRVVELAALGPVPFCGMLLADLGAEVTRVDRIGQSPMPIGDSGKHDVTGRGKKSLRVDIKDPGGVEIVLRMTERADALVEGFRPGVAERLGLGPSDCHVRNPALVYARMTGWGQDGPLSGDAGHDIDYIALSGVLASIGPDAHPVVPLNLVGDYGGGGMLLALGLLAAVLSAKTTGVGQVVDCAMVDGSALLMAPFHGLVAEGWWSPRRQENLLDGSAPFYTTYQTSDGGHMAVGALEPQFYAALLAGLELDPDQLPPQHDRTGWPVLREALADRFMTRTRDEWAVRFAGTDACVAPVLDMLEAVDHPHNVSRRTFLRDGDSTQPAPAPRFSETPLVAGVQPVSGQDTEQVLNSLGYSPDEICKLRESRTIV